MLSVRSVIRFCPLLLNCLLLTILRPSPSYNTLYLFLPLPTKFPYTPYPSYTFYPFLLLTPPTSSYNPFLHLLSLPTPSTPSYPFYPFLYLLPLPTPSTPSFTFYPFLLLTPPPPFLTNLLHLPIPSYSFLSNSQLLPTLPILSTPSTSSY